MFWARNGASTKCKQSTCTCPIALIEQPADEQKAALVGRRVLVAHTTPTVGWHIGRVRFVGVAAKWRKVCPTANFLVRYTKKETNGELTEGLEEARVSAANSGGQLRAR